MFINLSIFVYRGFYITLSEAQNIFRQNGWTCSASFNNSYSCSAIASFNSSWDPETNHFYWDTIFRKRGMAAATRENKEKEETFSNKPDG